MMQLVRPLLDIKIQQVMTEDEAHGSGPGRPLETTLLHPHRTGDLPLGAEQDILAAIAFRQAPHLNIRIPQLGDDRFHVIR